MSAELSYVQLKVKNEARTSVSKKITCYSCFICNFFSEGGGKNRAKKKGPFGAYLPVPTG